MKRFVSLMAVVGAAAATLVLAVAGGASGASTLPTLNIALTGTTGISVSGNPATGADNVVTTFKGTLPRGAHGPAVGIVRLDPGVTPQQAFQAVQSHHGDLNALTPYGALIVAANAPSVIQTVLAPGYTYIALNISGNGGPAAAPFNVSQSSSPAPLPKARSTETAIEFGFRGAKVLHDGTVVRAQNGGYLVHMIDLIGVRNRATGEAVMALLRAHKERAAQKLASRVFVSLLDPASPGAVQQQVLRTKPGYYLEACFMDTQDGREHVQLGMMRLVRVVRR